jgi:hypothetical protein
MKPRVTVCVTANGEFQIWLNSAGRAKLIDELRRLDESHEHFHLSPDREGEDFGEVLVQTTPYVPGDRIFEYGKVLFRTDDWDKIYFPHVIAAANSTAGEAPEAG